MHSRALLVGSPLALLDTDRSWELVNAARVEGEDWLSVANDVDATAIAEALNLCAMQLSKDYRIRHDDRINENADRITFQIQSAERHSRRLLHAQHKLLDRYMREGNKRLTPPTEGRIRSIENKFQVQIENSS